MSEETKDPNFFYVTVDRQKYNERIKRYYEKNRETILAKLKAKRDAEKEAKANGTYVEVEKKTRRKLEGDTIQLKVNKEKFKITSKKFYDANKERLNEKRRQNYKEGGSEKIIKDIYYEKNRLEIIEKTKARYRANKIERALSQDNNKKS
jgi:L-lactate utilization protein LutC